MKHLLLTTIAAMVLVGCGESAKDISIHDSAAAGDIEAVTQHLATGTDVNAKDDWNFTPLSYAAHAGHIEIAELLIANDAEVNANDDNGFTPLDYAMIDKHSETAALLRQHGGKTAEELKTTEPVAEAAQPEPSTAKAPDISIHEGASLEGNIEPLNSMAAGADVNEKSRSNMPTFFDVFFDILTKKPLLGVILATFLLIILLFILFYVNSHLRSRALNLGRADKLTETANTLNVNYYSDGIDSIYESIAFSKKSENGSDIVSNLMQGEVSNTKFAIFDREYTVRCDDSYTTKKYTAIYFSTANLNLPRFTLKPEGFGDQVATLAQLNLSTFKSEYQDIDFTSHPEFSKRFLLQGEDEEKIRAIFTDKLLGYFLTHQKITIEGKGNILIVYRESILQSDDRISTDQWTAFMDTAYQVFQQFTGSSEQLSLSDILKAAAK
jgi:hypothetical protein